MPLNISYMGTKRRLASAVAEVVSLAPTGPVLDLFSGMCAVGSAVAPSRQVWCNDVQRFAAEVATAFFTANGGPSHSLPVLNRTLYEFRRNARTLEARFRSELAAEAAALDSGKPDRIARTDAQAPNVAKSFRLNREREHLTRFTSMFPYRLFSITFSGGYFGLRQCIEIDSIRFAIDRLFRKKTIGHNEHRWMLLALCQAASKIANTTGHFAQYLKVKTTNVDRFVSQRQRSAWSEWQDAIRSLHPLGSTSWRQRNCVFQLDALSLLGSLRSAGTRPSVIYADPPYTADHYSRFYHLYETLIHYDYPRSIGIGRYRPDRFVSAFSLRAQVADQVERLIQGCSRVGAELVLSYPEKGLLENSKSRIPSMLRKYYSRYETQSVEHFHSSLGGSTGFEKRPVVEIIYRAH